MLVKERMTPNPVTVQVDKSIAELSTLMKDNKLKKIPVLDGDKLVGIVTDKDVDRVSPSGATLLSVFEIAGDQRGSTPFSHAAAAKVTP